MEEEAKGDFNGDFIEEPIDSKPIQSSIVYEDENLDFSVSSPQMQSGHIVYRVRGTDREGTWEVVRRYN
jgi:hypothetical protein